MPWKGNRTRALKSPWICTKKGSPAFWWQQEIALLSYSPQAPWWVFQSLNPQTFKKEKNSPWASHRKWNAGNTVSKYSPGLTVSPFYCWGCNHSSRVIISPCPGAGLAALPGNAGRWFSPMPFRTSLCWQELREQKGELFQISFSTSAEWK